MIEDEKREEKKREEREKERDRERETSLQAANIKYTNACICRVHISSLKFQQAEREREREGGLRVNK